MPASEKHHVIDRIFDLLWDPATNSLTRTVVTQQDVQDAINWAITNRNVSLSTRNVANFMKDVVRGFGGNKMWPQRLRDLRITAVQRTGDGNSFEFRPYEPGQTEPFPNPFEYRPGETPAFQVQSLSMPSVTKALGRNDETYLIQVAVKLAVVETHFALSSPWRDRVEQIHHLQVGVKLGQAEIDSMYLATINEGGESKPVIISAEAKRRGQRILENQIEAQVRAAFRAMPGVDRVIPIAMTSAEQGLFVVEFKHVERAELATFTELELVTDAFYQLVPAVNGIGSRPRRNGARPSAPPSP